MIDQTSGAVDRVEAEGTTGALDHSTRRGCEMLWQHDVACAGMLLDEGAAGDARGVHVEVRPGGEIREQELNSGLIYEISTSGGLGARTASYCFGAATNLARLVAKAVAARRDRLTGISS